MCLPVQLLKANASWDNYSKKLREDFDQKSLGLRRQLSVSYEKIERYRQSEESRQADTDKMLQNVKKRAEKAEVLINRLINLANNMQITLNLLLLLLLCYS